MLPLEPISKLYPGSKAPFERVLSWLQVYCQLRVGVSARGICSASGALSVMIGAKRSRSSIASKLTHRRQITITVRAATVQLIFTPPCNFKIHSPLIGNFGIFLYSYRVLAFPHFHGSLRMENAPLIFSYVLAGFLISAAITSPLAHLLHKRT